MDFEKLGITNTTEELLKIISLNNKRASVKREEIREAEIATIEHAKRVVSEENPQIFKSFMNATEKKELTDEIEYYVEEYKKLPSAYTKEDLLNILPSRKNYHFKSIVLRLIAEAIKETKEIEELINEEKETISPEDIDDLKESLKSERVKISFLREVLNPQSELDETFKNRIVLVPTLAGNIRLINEVEHLPSEFKPVILELINSIVNRTFKGVKRLTSNLFGMSEVRHHQIRVVFKRIDKDAYALITVFVKKSNNDTGYLSSLKKKLIDFKYIEDTLKAKIDDSEFLTLNDSYVSELFRLLEEDTKAKEMKKGGKND